MDQRLSEPERKRHTLSWHHCLQQHPQLLVQVGKAARQILVVIARQESGLNRSGEGGQRARKREHGGIEYCWVSTPGLEQMAELWQMTIDGVQQPEAGHVGNAEVRKALIL